MQRLQITVTITPVILINDVIFINLYNIYLTSVLLETVVPRTQQI